MTVGEFSAFSSLVSGLGSLLLRPLTGASGANFEDAVVDDAWVCAIPALSTSVAGAGSNACD